MSRMSGDLSRALDKFLWGSKMELRGGKALHLPGVSFPSACFPCKFLFGLSESFKETPLSVSPQWAFPYSHNISFILCQRLTGLLLFYNWLIILLPWMFSSFLFPFLSVYIWNRSYTCTCFKKPNLTAGVLCKTALSHASYPSCPLQRHPFWPLPADHVSTYFPFSKKHGCIASSWFVSFVFTLWLPPVLCGRWGFVSVLLQFPN